MKEDYRKRKTLKINEINQQLIMIMKRTIVTRSAIAY